MKYLPLILFVSFAHASDLWFKIGEVRSLAAPTGQAVRVGSHGIIKVIDGHQSVRVVALKSGVTPLVIGEKNYLVHVSAGAQKDFTLALADLVKNMRGLRVDFDMQPVAIRGTLLRFSDWQRIAALQQRERGEYLFQAQALPDVAEQAVQYLQHLAKTKGYPIVRFRFDPQFTAQIPNAAHNLKANATELFQAYGIRVDSSDSDLMLQPLIRTRVILAELSKTVSREMGIEWPGDYQAQVLPKFNGEDSLLLTLKALESRGQAQILASPNLICSSGGEAKFHAGGEFPIKMFSRFVHDVIWKQHGVILNVKPQADFQGAMSLEIETEVSTLDMANAVEGIPALKSNTVKSHFDLPGKRTIALSGLLRQDSSTTKEGLPYLTGIPVLGALFSSQKFVKNQSELVIFVTPEIYLPESDEKVELPSGWSRDGI